MITIIGIFFIKRTPAKKREKAESKNTGTGIIGFKDQCSKQLKCFINFGKEHFSH